MTGEKGSDRRAVLGIRLANQFHFPGAQDYKPSGCSGSLKISLGRARASRGSRNPALLSKEGKDATADTCCGDPGEQQK